MRERIASLGGKASSSDLLPFLRVSKAAVEALPGLVMTQARNGKQGRPVTFYSFDHAHAVSTPTSAESDARPVAARAVAATKATPKRVTVRIPAQAAPVAVQTDNPFAALI